MLFVGARGYVLSVFMGHEARVTDMIYIGHARTAAIIESFRASGAVLRAITAAYLKSLRTSNVQYVAKIEKPYSSTVNMFIAQILLIRF